MESIWPAIDGAFDIEIADTPAAVFAALTKDVGGWWGHPFVTARATALARTAAGRPVHRTVGGGQVIASMTGWARTSTYS